MNGLVLRSHFNIVSRVPCTLIIISGHTRAPEYARVMPESYPVIPGHTRSYPVTPGHTRSYPVIPGHTRAYLVIPGHTMLHRTELWSCNLPCSGVKKSEPACFADSTQASPPVEEGPPYFIRSMQYSGHTRSYRPVIFRNRGFPSEWNYIQPYNFPESVP